MAAEGTLAVRPWKVGRYTCTLTLLPPLTGAVLGICVEWAPAQPKRPLTDSELAEYRAGRDAALEDAAAQLGVAVAVVEL